jgi:hypothetical protein
VVKGLFAFENLILLSIRLSEFFSSFVLTGISISYYSYNVNRIL